jgi:hypothetical protein
MKSFLKQLLAVVLLAHAPRLAAAQSPAVVLPVDDLHAIAVDFDQGLSPLYCYFGARVDQPAPIVRVDSVTLVVSPARCAGMGVAFFMRATDRVLLSEAVRGVIESNPRFDVVSVFYQTEEIEHRGVCVRAARALSVVRGAASAARQGGSSS